MHVTPFTCDKFVIVFITNRFMYFIIFDLQNKINIMIIIVYDTAILMFITHLGSYSPVMGLHSIVRYDKKIIINNRPIRQYLPRRQSLSAPASSSALAGLYARKPPSLWESPEPSSRTPKSTQHGTWLFPNV